jgi:hypothetical protein
MYEGESNENLKKILPANLVQIGLVQLCHFSTQCPLCSMHALQCFTNAWIPHEKNLLAACVAIHALPLALLHWTGKSFHQESP